MNALEEVNEYCPYCGEGIQLLVDYTETDCHYIEDCQVCCRPMVIALRSDGGLTVHREDDA